MSLTYGFMDFQEIKLQRIMASRQEL